MSAFSRGMGGLEHAVGIVALLLVVMRPKRRDSVEERLGRLILLILKAQGVKVPKCRWIA